MSPMTPISDEMVERAARVKYERVRARMVGQHGRRIMPEWDSDQMLPEYRDKDREDMRAALEAAETVAEKALVEAALHWRRLHGPATDRTSTAMSAVASCAEAVIAERNRANQPKDQTPTATPPTRAEKG